MDVSTISEEACASEPIHIPGSIQPHGALVVIDADQTVIQASVNLADILGVAHGEAIGKTLSDIAPEQVAHAVGAAKLTQSGQAIALLRSIGIGDALYDVLAHRAGERVIVEFEQTEIAGTLDAIYPNLRTYVEKISDLDSVDAISEMAAREVFELTGFDRVLIYKFDENWNGTVIAEAGNLQLPSYLDLRFPASDIPAQARDLYRLNRLRLIPDADYNPIPIAPALDPDTRAPLDLSFSVLRSVSPVHLQYMRNMGTPASMSISIVDDKKLWGLISCHNASPRRVPSNIRTSCE